MIGFGILFIVLGAGSLLLPQLGYQFTLMELVDDLQPFAGIVVAIIGVALVVLGMRRRDAPQAAATPQSTDPTRQP